jgi:molybdate transport system substrate-binding protein
VSIAAAAALVAGCGDDASGSGAASARGGSSTPSSDVEGTLTVSAAAALTDAFTAIGDDFMEDNPGVEVTFDFDSSSTLARQITDGAPADVFASADEATMARLSDAGLVAGEPEVFARNEMVIVTKPGNPEGITGLADLAGAGVVALCGAEAPCGRYARRVLGAAGVSVAEADVTRGQNASATLVAVTQADAVAAIVYRSDAVRAGAAAEAVAIPNGQNVVAAHPIGVVAATADPDLARAFVAAVTGPDGQAVLEEAGFLPAP